MPLDIQNNILLRVNEETTAQELRVPEGVTGIGYRAFVKCPNLMSLSLPTTLKRIDDHALDQCTRLESLTVPQRVRLIGNCAFSRHTALNFRTKTVPLFVPPRTSYYESGDAAVMADLLHKKQAQETEQLFPTLKSFEFRAAAAVWLMQEQKPRGAAQWLTQNAASVMQMYLERGSTGMLHLMLQTGVITPEMLEETITLAIDKGDNEIYMMLVNHKQEAYGISDSETGTMRL